MQSIVKTGFYVSLTSYVIFWLLDAMRPGFVSRSFSVHLFLLAAIMFGVWWGIVVKEYMDRPWVQMCVTGILGIVLAVIVWIFGEQFGLLRLLITLLSLFIPMLFWNLLRRS